VSFDWIAQQAEHAINAVNKKLTEVAVSYRFAHIVWEFRQQENRSRDYGRTAGSGVTHIHPPNKRRSIFKSSVLTASSPGQFIPRRQQHAPRPPCPCGRFLFARAGAARCEILENGNLRSELR
jgi:hypothetical protein